MEKRCDFPIETLQTMWSKFQLVLSVYLSLFRLLTVFSFFSVCAAFQPFHKLMLHHQLASADPQGWKIRAVQKVVSARFGNLQCLLCIHHIRHGFKRFSTHKNLLSCMKKQQSPFRSLLPFLHLFACPNTSDIPLSRNPHKRLLSWRSAYGLRLRSCSQPRLTDAIIKISGITFL